MDLPTDDLLAMLGREVAGPKLGPGSWREAIQVGREWLLDNQARLRDALCSHRDKIDTKVNPSDALAGIADLLASLNDLPALATVSVLVYRYGLDSLCSGWTQ